MPCVQMPPMTFEQMVDSNARVYSVSSTPKQTKTKEQKVNSHKLSSALKAVLKGNSTKSASNSGVSTPARSGAATPARSGSVSSQPAEKYRDLQYSYAAISHFSIRA